jgi:hypothetical protein
MRAAAIDALSSTNISVIDREQLKLLIDPKRELSDCAGLCAVELTRELGAQWALSASLTSDQTLKAGEASLTLKLHSAEGQTLAIKQAEGSLRSLIHQSLRSLTHAVLNAGLLKRDAERGQSRRGIEYQAEHQASHAEEAEDTEVAYEESAKEERKEPVRSSTWTLLKHQDHHLCVSPLVTTSQFQACVSAQRCQPLPRRRRCLTRGDLPVRCVNLQQALQYSRWAKASLPTALEWAAWRAQVSSKESLFEWLSPEALKATIEEWETRILSLDTSDLRKEKPLTVLRAYPVKERKSPLAFALPDLSFRLVKDDLRECRP